MDYHKLDRWGRVAGTMWVASPDSPCQALDCPKTLDAWLAQLTVGLAWHFKKYQHE
jgi:hypothetical protein